MEDEKETPVVAEQEVTSTSEQTTDVQQEVDTSEVASVEEHKPTRAERRISQLSTKLKEAEERARQYKGTANEIYADDQPLVSPEEYETGIDPSQFEARVGSKVQAEVQKALRQQEAITNYRDQINEHASDLESVLMKYPALNPESDEYDADLEAAFLERFDEVNTDLQGNFLGRKKASNIAESLYKIYTRGGQIASAKVTGKIVEQAGEQAITPNASGEMAGDYESEKLFEQAKDTGSVADWAEVLKRRVAMPNQK